MSSGARPNLGGLFNGSTPPDRVNGATGVLRPTLILSTPLVEHDESTTAGPDLADPVGPEPVSPVRAQRPGRWPTREWLDPVNAVERYFAVLQSLLDANRGLAVALATTVSSLPRRLGLRS